MRGAVRSARWIVSTALVVASALAAPGSNAAAQQDGAQPDNGFSAAGPWNTPLPANAPLAANSQAVVNNLLLPRRASRPPSKIIDSSNSVLAQATAQLTIEQSVPVFACHVAYRVQSEWPSGFTTALSITDTGQVAVNGWTLAFTFGGDQQLGTVWGATGSQNGAAVTLRNLPYDAAMAPGQTLSGVGFIATWSASAAAPTGFTLNGTLCT